MNITIQQPQWYDGIVATPQNREEITSQILSKMYSAVLDQNNTVSFSGYLYSPTGKWSQAEYLMQQFNNLTIDIPTSGRYVAFADPEVERILSTTYGDGVGVTQSDMSAVTTLPAIFRNNTQITQFNELSQFTQITGLAPGAFKGCTSLTSIDLTNVESVGTTAAWNDGAFSGCTSLSSVTGLSSVKVFGGQAFQNCSSLGLGQDLVLNPTNDQIPNAAFAGTLFKSVVVNGRNITAVDGYRSVHGAFSGMPNATYLDLSNTSITGCYSDKPTNIETLIYPDTVTYITWNGVPTSTKHYIILATTPPTLENTTYLRMTSGNFYVPDSAVPTYKSTWPATGYGSWNIHDHVKGLSELPVGVWKTGLYQQYEPYLSNSSDPAYATT